MSAKGVSFLLLASLLITAGAPVWAGEKSNYRSSGKMHLVNQPTKGSCTTSVTTGWRQISGWEHNITKRDANLNHWEWLAMQEMNKNYMHLAPGQVSQKGVKPPAPRYIKPQHISTPRTPSYHPPVFIAGKDAPGGHYVKPNHVATVIPPPRVNPLPDRQTAIRLSAPKTDIALSAPKTDIKLAAPSTNIKLAAPKTSVALAAPKAHGQLVSKQTHIQLSAPSTSIALREEKGTARLRPPDALAGDTSPANMSDSFSNPDAYEHNVYGLDRRVSTAGHSSGHGAVKGRLVSHRSKSR